MEHSYNEILSLLTTGGGVSIDASKRTYLESNSLATAARNNGATLVLRNASKFSYNELLSIATSGKDKVIVEI